MNVTATQKIVFRGHQGGVYGLSEGNETSLIYSGSSDKFVGAWDLISGQQKDFAIEFSAPVYSLCTYLKTIYYSQVTASESCMKLILKIK